MTLWDVFISHAKELHLAITRVPGNNGYADRLNRVVAIGSDWASPIEAAIVGLHEIGHLKTQKDPTVLFRAKLEMVFGNLSEKTWAEIYADEMAAWAWAATVVPDDYREKFEEIRAWALKSYERPVFVKG